MTVTVPGLLMWPSVSATVYCTGVGLPVKPLSGAKVILPVLASTVHVPSPATVRLVTGWPLAPTSLTLFGSMVLLPCASVSLARTSTVTGWPLVPFMVSALATGASSPGCGCGFGLGFGFGGVVPS